MPLASIAPRGSRRDGRPRTRTTEARRFPPPSGPEDTANASQAALIRRSPAAARAACAAPGRPPTGAQVPAARRPRRELGERSRRTPLNAAWSPIGAHSEPRRTNIQPSAKRDRQPRRRTPTTARPATCGEAVAADGQDVREREEQRRPDDRRRCRRPSARQAVDREAAEEDLLGDRRDDRARDEVGRSARSSCPVGGSGASGTTLEDRRRGPRRRSSVRPITGQRERGAGREVAAAASTSGRSQPISAHDSAPVPTTSSRITPEEDRRLERHAEQAGPRSRRCRSGRAATGATSPTGNPTRRSRRSSRRRRGTATGPA